jgi:hypothetical protein
VDLPDGAYTATVTVNPLYRRLFQVPAGQASVRVAFTVHTTRDPASPPHLPTDPQPTPPPPPAGGAAWVPQGGPLPDLRSLPAWAVAVSHGKAGDELSFAATVWTAGTSPLVVDGFRRPGSDLMDAYQSFYDAAGRRVGQVPAGTFEWDPRGGHRHWHFTDYARYRLLDAGGQVAVRNHKEAFCLSNTDAIDYARPGANWQPDHTGLDERTCGDRHAQALRQRQDIGSGDTYAPGLPGQSFVVTDLPNGVYFIEVTANPSQRLHESDTTNNTSRRQVILGGVPGHRTVQVPPYQGIDH